MGQTKAIQALTKLTSPLALRRPFLGSLYVVVQMDWKWPLAGCMSGGASLTGCGDTHRSTWCRSGVLAAPQMLDPVELRGTYGTDQPDGRQRAAMVRVWLAVHGHSLE